MILRLRRYRLSLKIAIYVLPIVVFGLGWWVWMFVSMVLGRPALYDPGGHFTQIIFGTVVWALIAEHYGVTSFDELFRERTGRAPRGRRVSLQCQYCWRHSISAGMPLSPEGC